MEAVAFIEEEISFLNFCILNETGTFMYLVYFWIHSTQLFSQISSELEEVEEKCISQISWCCLLMFRVQGFYIWKKVRVSRHHQHHVLGTEEFPVLSLEMLDEALKRMGRIFTLLWNPLVSSASGKCWWQLYKSQRAYPAKIKQHTATDVAAGTCVLCRNIAWTLLFVFPRSEFKKNRQ